tara:strand:+ start:6800 stop:7396 length:597 start_codon:yes stop_codon:yes gene_type:complete
MASPSRIISIGDLTIRADYISRIGEVGSEIRVYYTSGYVTTVETIVALIVTIPEFVTLTSVDGGTLYINALNVLGVGNTVSQTRIDLRSGAVDVIEDIAAVKDAINAALQRGLLLLSETTVSIDYTVLDSDDLLYVDTADVTITVPATRTSRLIIKNTSTGNITLDPLTNTIEGEDTGLITRSSSWTIALSSTNWEII